MDFGPGVHPTLFSLAGLKEEIERLLNAEVDLVLHRALRPTLRDRVEREAVRVA